MINSKMISGVGGGTLEYFESPTSQEVFPFIESNRYIKTFEEVQKLGEGANG